jgi:hypothetical protein
LSVAAERAGNKQGKETVNPDDGLAKVANSEPSTHGPGHLRKNRKKYPLLQDSNCQSGALYQKVK